MLTDNRAHYRPEDWFLIACEGDLVLKLAHNLMIGEDEHGHTVLSPAQENALLKITSDNGGLTLQALAMEWTFSENGGLSRQNLTFVEGLTLRLSLPNSSLIIAPDFQAGSRVLVDREIELKPTKTPTVTLSRVNEPIILNEPPLLEAPAVELQHRQPLDSEDISIDEVAGLLEAAYQQDADETFLSWGHDVPDEKVPGEVAPDEEILHDGIPDEVVSGKRVSVVKVSGKKITKAPSDLAPAEREPDEFRRGADNEAPLLTANFPQPGSVAEAAFQKPVTADANSAATPTKWPTTADRRMARHRTLGGLIAAAALVAPMVFFMSDSEELGINFPLTNYRSPADAPMHAWPETPAVITETPAGPGSLAAEQTPQTMEIDPAAQTIASTLAPEETAVSDLATDLPEQDRLLIESLLAEAKAFYDAGAIVTPVQSNAVRNLTQVLHMDPTNEEGLHLMYLSAVRLIDEAQIAHDAGDDYLARNLVEDVLGFHPEFQEAQNLLKSWNSAPES